MSWNVTFASTVVKGLTLYKSALQISQLLPATEYLVRIIAINHLGRSPPSEILRVTTSAEKPGEAPREVLAEAVGPKEVKVAWRPPSKDKSYGKILGYYLGYAETSRTVRLVLFLFYFR